MGIDLTNKKNRSLKKDLWLIFKTIAVLFNRKNSAV